MVNDLTLKRWEQEYIEGLDLNQRDYLLHDKAEMKSFIKGNYYDEETKRYVTGKSDVMLMGLQYLDYDCGLISGDNVRYLLCYVKNNKGTNTILSELIYHENCMKVVRNQIIPVTLIEYLEVNSYFRNRGLNKDLLSVFVDFVNEDNMILTTSQSVMGFKCHVYESLKEMLIKNGFQNDIRTLSQMDENYMNYLQGKEKQLKKTL